LLFECLFAALETATNPQVTLQSVEPSSESATVRVQAEASSAETMLDYLEALQQDERLGSVVLTSHEVQTQRPGTPISFQIEADWKRP
jgi:Tfp pilus assembly protein PilN